MQGLISDYGLFIDDFFTGPGRFVWHAQVKKTFCLTYEELLFAFKLTNSILKNIRQGSIYECFPAFYMHSLSVEITVLLIIESLILFASFVDLRLYYHGHFLVHLYSLHRFEVFLQVVVLPIVFQGLHRYH
jgi:hypothetical protein